MARLTSDDVACWVLKTATAPTELLPGWAPGEERLLTRCLRPSYRLALMAAGQPCLLWLSGRDRPGVHAVGSLAGHPVDRPEGPAVPVRLSLLGDPVPRPELLADVRFAAAEVLRMPAGGNPSWLTAGQFAAVLTRVSRSSLGPWET